MRVYPGVVALLLLAAAWGAIITGTLVLLGAR